MKTKKRGIYCSKKFYFYCLMFPFHWITNVANAIRNRRQAFLRKEPKNKKNKKNRQICMATRPIDSKHHKIEPNIKLAKKYYVFAFNRNENWKQLWFGSCAHSSDSFISFSVSFALLHSFIAAFAILWLLIQFIDTGISNSTA